MDRDAKDGQGWTRMNRDDLDVAESVGRDAKSPSNLESLTLGIPPRYRVGDEVLDPPAPSKGRIIKIPESYP